MEKIIDSLQSNSDYEARVAAAGDGVTYGDSDFSVTATFSTPPGDGGEDAPLGYVSRTIDGLASGTEYDVRVAGAGDQVVYGDSVFTDSITFTTLGSPALGKVSVTLTSLDSDTEYEALVVAKGDKVDYDDSDESSLITFKTLSDFGWIHYTLKNLDPGTEYEAAVCAKGDGITYGDSDFCDTVVFTTLGEAFWEARHYNVITNVVAANEPRHNYDCLFEVIGVDEDNRLRVGQAITILARVFDAFYPDTPLLNEGDNVTSISYTCERRRKGISSDPAIRMTEGLFAHKWTPVAGHTDVVVDNSCLLSEMDTTSDRWTRDSKGFNFIMTPDITAAPLFSEIGEYRVCTRIKLTNGNPVVFYTYFTVVDVAVERTSSSENAGA